MFRNRNRLLVTATLSTALVAARRQPGQDGDHDERLPPPWLRLRQSSQRATRSHIRKTQFKLAQGGSDIGVAGRRPRQGDDR